ncbi:hypothetical protein ACH5RR_000816 [Cinchona calisaya]|uniref:Uncharacterized protein n=1 Tax=Cinchona calisaya TaxID=153742 RepID=A0ABD3B1P3_9GENT
MAALFIGHCFHSKSSSRQLLQPKNDPRIIMSVSCENRQSSDPLNTEVAKKEKKEHKRILPELFLSVDKFGKGLRDNLSPKQKGDWKDLTLMSLSFALYVYISQKLVCTYCAWMSMAKSPW